jgi:DNA-binding NarL/FixJ family response regulator
MIQILLVDDNATFLSAVRRFLDKIPGIDVVGQAMTAAEGCEAVNRLKPGIVLLDIALPDRSGLELAPELLAQPHAPQIIFLSMHDSDAYRLAAVDLGALFVAKSDFVADLLPLLEQMVQARPGGPHP